jgi:C-terminal processing protease CtpA/Prc
MRKIWFFLLVMALLLVTSFVVQAAASFGGVGIDGVPQSNGEIKVRQLVAGGPAHLAGVKVGDLITHIDGTPTKGSDFTTIVNRRLRGKVGSRVVLTVKRSGSEKPLRFTLTRRELVVSK